MNDYVDVEMKGLDTTMKALTAYGVHARTKGAVNMTRTASAVFARKVKQNCPVGVKSIEGSSRFSKRADKQPGNLRNSVKSVRILKRAQKAVYYNVGFTQGRKYKYDGWYATLVEFGVAPHTIPKVRLGRKVGRDGERKGRTVGLKIRMRIGANYFIGPIEHPGHIGTRFVTRAFEESYGMAIAKGQKAFDRTLKKFKGHK